MLCNAACGMDGLTIFTFDTSIVIAAFAGHIIPRVTIVHTQGVDTVLVFPVVWLLRSPEAKTGYFLVYPHKRSLDAPVIETNPRSLSIVAVLYVDIFLLVVHCHQM